MEKKYVYAVLLFFLGVPMAYGLNVTAFDNGDENILMISNITRNLTIGKGISVHNATLNIKFPHYDDTFKENATWYYGDEATVWINYFLGGRITTSTNWQTKHGKLALYNTSIPESCIYNETLHLQFQLTASGVTEGKCKNSTGLYQKITNTDSGTVSHTNYQQTLSRAFDGNYTTGSGPFTSGSGSSTVYRQKYTYDSSSPGVLWEEGLYLDYEKYTNQSTFKIYYNDVLAYNRTGNLSGQNYSIDLNQNNALDNCFNDSNVCNIMFEAQDYIAVNMSNMFIDYDYNILTTTCNATNPLLYNFSLYDEDITTSLTGDISAVILYTTGNQTNEILSQKSNTTYLDICVENYVPDGFVNITLRTTSDFTTQFFYYNLNLNDTPDFFDVYNQNDTSDYSLLNLVIRDNSYKVYPDIAAKLYRYYPSNNTWVNVQSDLSDNFGQLIYYIIEEDVDYRIDFYDINTFLDTTGIINFICTAGLCEASFQINPDSTSNLLKASATYSNTTENITVTWTDVSEDTETVEILVYKEENDDSALICENTYSGASGSAQCDVSANLDGTFSVMVSKNSETYPTYYTLIDAAGTKLADFLGLQESSLFAFFIIIVMIGAGLTKSPALVVFLDIFAFGIMAALGFSLVINTAFVTIIGIMGLAVMAVMK